MKEKRKMLKSIGKGKWSLKMEKKQAKDDNEKEIGNGKQ